MGDINGFLKVKRKEAGNRPVIERICDFSEIEQILNSDDRRLQASRCMECGVPFCHWSCPLDNLIPEWNDLLYKGDWEGAYKRLIATNNFPEFTGRICPAPCEHGCVLNIYDDQVTIRENEVAIVEKAFSEGYVRPAPPSFRTGRKVAVIGSGPAGMAAADLLNRDGHEVTLYEKSAKAGGLLRYGVPDFKLSKATIDRRLEIMMKEGIRLRTNFNIGVDVSVHDIAEQYDAVCIATGATEPRDLKVEGRDLSGIHFALDFLSHQNRVNNGETVSCDMNLNAMGQKVLVIGGGDTGSDCVGTAIRQKAASVTQIEIMPKPPDTRDRYNPWPYAKKVLKTTTSHEEGCARIWSLSTVRFVGHVGNVTGAEVEEVAWIRKDGTYSLTDSPGRKFVIETDMVLLAMGFEHPMREGLIKSINLRVDDGKYKGGGMEHATGIPKVFVAGDAATGPGLVVRAIASGRSAAREMNRFLKHKAGVSV